ncbi:Aste57867_10466 [Aphanomyces stellatus]|uniref:Aste57867_10466 protein n=1 Tax=Aphanomyces stellatus TaxID=120398 RepID=A0A485KQY4_9STRA|nr:hypothetical protein As57867_010426 [Aphanomyces stellatus]VFT87340.1 Aste57867_10466 [Aphanomyces stellatus]
MQFCHLKPPHSFRDHAPEKMLPAEDMRALEEADMRLSEEADRILQTESHLRVLVARFGNNSLVVKSLYLHQFNTMVRALEELTKATSGCRRLESPRGPSPLHDEQVLVHQLQRWLHAHSNVMDTALSPHNESWRDVALYADPLRRDQGMRWITESMYRKTDAMFQSHGLYRHDDLRDSFCDFQIAFDNGCYNVIQTRQAELDVPFETVLEMHQTHLGATFMLDYFHPSGFETLQELAGNLSVHRLVTNKDVCMHLLSGIFHEKDRTVIVVRQIEDDEKHNNMDYCQRSRMTLDVRRIPRRKKTKMRTFTILSQSFTRAGVAPLEEEAMRWGIDLSHVPEEMREDVFAKEGRLRFNSRVGLRKKQFMDLAEYARQTKIRPFYDQAATTTAVAHV